MKVAIDVTQAIYGTGVSVYTKSLVTQLVRSNPEHSFTLFGGSLRRKRDLDLWINRMPQVTNRTNHLSPKMAHFIWNSLHLFPAEIFTGPVDLIHTSDWAEPPSKIPKVTTIHDLAMFRDPEYTHPEVARVHKKRLYWVMKESAKIIAVSQATKNDIIQYLGIEAERIDVIPEAATIPTPTLNSQEITTQKIKKLGIHKPYIVIPGSGHPRKNIDRAIKAFKQSNLDLHLVIVGRPSPQEQQLASNNVIFTGFVTQLDFALLISQAQVVLFPSLYEGFGLPILDAFTVGTPVVTSNVSSMPEVAGSAAVLVDPNSVESISDGIIDALENRGILIQKGHKQVKKFSWEKTAASTMALYEEVVKSR